MSLGKAMIHARKQKAIARSVIHAPEAAAQSTDLPAGVSVHPGVLMISFNSEEQLLERLFLLARVFAANPQLLSSLPKA